MNTMIVSYQAAYDAELSRMLSLGHSEMFAQVAAGRFAAKWLCVEVA